jgi:hypothetical protein
MIFEAAGVWDLATVGTDHLFRFYAQNLGKAPYKEATVNPDFTVGNVVLQKQFFPTDASVDCFDFPFDELLVLHHLASRGGVLIHACGLIDEGAGCLFVGHSGAGKTTTALLWQERTDVRIVSDDRVALRCGRDGITMYGTPWHGTGRMASPASAPLAAVFLLERGDESKLKSLAGAEAVTELLARCFIPYHDQAAAAGAIALLEQVIDSVPCFRFPFRPDETAVAVVEDWMAHHGRG